MTLKLQTSKTNSRLALSQSYTASATDEEIFRLGTPQLEESAVSSRSLKRDKTLDWPPLPKRSIENIGCECCEAF
jgi:hypothetical protein